jgi:hypothetical protein
MPAGASCAGAALLVEPQSASNRERFGRGRLCLARDPVGIDQNSGHEPPVGNLDGDRVGKP